VNRTSHHSSGDLPCRVKYQNNLPDIPFDPKFLAYPFDRNRFIHYKSTTLEKNFKRDILTEQDLGVRIDLINQDYTRIDPEAKINPIDASLLEDETITPADLKRSASF
jgi:RNA polymerase II-associated factor 1